MSEPLQIEWQPQPLPDTVKGMELIIRDPRALSAKMLNLDEEAIPLQREMTLAEFWEWFQENLAFAINEQLATIQAQSTLYHDSLTIQMRYVQTATTHLIETFHTVLNKLETTLTAPSTDASSSTTLPDPME